MNAPIGTEDVESSKRPSVPAWSDWPIRAWAMKRFFAAYVILVAIGLAVGGVLVHTPLGDGVENADVDASEWFELERTAELTELSETASDFGGTIPVVATVVVLSVAFVLFFKRWRESATLISALGLEALVFVTVSTIIGRSRPPIEQLDISPPTASFPSGHTGAAASLYLTLAAIVWWRTDNMIARALAVLGAVALPISVALSRNYRGMHFVSDVVVGLLLGAAAAIFAIRIVELATDRMRA